jgi:GNAT superfamily N-acetyltransferase
MAKVRPAVPGDGDRLALIHVTSWQWAYRGLLPDEFLDGLSVADRAEWWRIRLEGLRPRQVVLVVEQGGGAQGFAFVGPVAGGEDDQGELYAIYLDPDAAGTGLGRQLIADAERQLAALGFSRAELWVLEANGRARRFYEAAGWQVAAGELRIEKIGGVDANEVCYRKALTLRSSGRGRGRRRT